MVTAFIDWLSEAPIPILSALLFGAAIVSGIAGRAIRRWSDRRYGPEAEHTGEGYIVSAVLGLLALLTGFTLSLTLDRFETRRILVLEDANAINAMYLYAQMLGEPHRARLSNLLVEYTENRVALGHATRDREGARLLANNHRLVRDISAATAAAFDSISNLDFSSTLINAAEHVRELDATRRTARVARIPTIVFAVLTVYLISTSAILGYVIFRRRNQVVASFALALLILSLLLIIDLDRPTMGSVLESQGPMERLLESMRSQPPKMFDRWRTPP